MPDRLSKLRDLCIIGVCLALLAGTLAEAIVPHGAAAEPIRVARTRA